MLEVATGLRGTLDAEFVARGRTTTARVNDASAPLELRGPFEASGFSRFYLRNVTCGVFSGDRYDVRLRAAEHARAYVSATSATKVHAMPDGCATSQITVRSSPRATIAYFDGPTILQEGADLTQSVEINAHGGLAIYAEVLVLGRLACGESLEFRRYGSELVVRDEAGRELYVERYELRPGDHRSTLAAASHPIVAKVIAAGAVAASALDDLDLDGGEDLIAGGDQLPSNSGVIVRATARRLDTVVRFVESTIAHLIVGSG